MESPECDSDKRTARLRRQLTCANERYSSCFAARRRRHPFLLLLAAAADRPLRHQPRHRAGECTRLAAAVVERLRTQAARWRCHKARHSRGAATRSLLVAAAVVATALVPVIECGQAQGYSALRRYSSQATS